MKLLFDENLSMIETMTRIETRRLGRMPRGTHLGQDDGNPVTDLLPDRYLDRYDREFLYRMLGAAIRLRARLAELPGLRAVGEGQGGGGGGGGSGRDGAAPAGRVARGQRRGGRADRGLARAARGAAHRDRRRVGLAPARRRSRGRAPRGAAREDFARALSRG